MGMTIRNNVFETNSSSTHSLHIGCGDKIFPKLDNDGNIVIYLDEYGWEFNEYYDLHDRMSYVFSYLCNSDVSDLLIDLIDYIKLQTGANEVIFKGSHYYVDHGYEHLTLNFEWLIDFMFNDGSWFETGNDN